MAIKYKIQTSQDGTDTIIKLSSDPNHTGWSIPKNPENSDYQQFLQDVKEQGLGVVEGPEVLVKEDYATARREAYGPIEDQLDKIYHKGLDVWKSDILAIKDEIPRSQERTTSVGSVPDWVQTEADAYSP